MKRFFFSLIALSAAAIGCTQSAMLETPELGGIEVSFSPYTGRTPETKATSIVGATGNPTDDNGKATGLSLAAAGGFKVYGFENPSKVVMENAQVNYSSGSWVPSTTVYWPSNSSTTLAFVAYSANAANYLTSTSDGFTFTVPSVANQVDLLATPYYDGRTLENTTDGTTKGQLGLYFYHLLTRIGFKITTTGAGTVTINSMSFGGKMPESGTLTFKNSIVNPGETSPAIPPTLSPGEKGNRTYSIVDGGTKSYSGSAQRIILSADDNDYNDYLMIMPHTVREGDDNKINITYTITSGTGTTQKSTSIDIPVGFDFQQGKAYEFVLKVSTSAITFTIDETPWDATTDQTDTLEPEDQPVVSISGVNVHTRLSSATAAKADILLTANKSGYELGVKYREVGTEVWKDPITATNNSEAGTNYTATLPNLSALTQYEYTIYSKKGGSEIEYAGGTFTTSAYVSLEISNETGVGATVTGDCDDTAGSVSIVKRGFCWTVNSSTDANNPTIPTKIHYTYDCAANAGFTHMINNCSPSTNYSCSAYVVNANGEYSYSVPVTFTTTDDAFLDEDNTGGSSSNGGSTDFE